MSHCIPIGIQNGDPIGREGSEPLPAESRAGGLRATYTRPAHMRALLLFGVVFNKRLKL